MPPRHARSMPIPNVKRMTDKFICLMAFSFGEVAEKLVYVGKLSLSYISNFIVTHKDSDHHTNLVSEYVVKSMLMITFPNNGS
ncbi:hypothetical protein ACT3HK_10930 [Thermolongibacillus altinsuensis]